MKTSHFGRLAAALSLCAATIAPHANAISFGTPIDTTPLTNGSRTLAVADFNGDGRPDVAIGVALANVISIRLGAGNGTFGAATDYPATAFPSRVIAADFNADGFMDLAVTSQTASVLGILLGNGDGTFQAVVSYPLANINGFHLAAADFNGDGRPDLAVAHQAAVSILLNNGNGTFAAAVLLATGTGMAGVAIADFDSSGQPDVIASQGNFNGLDYWQGLGGTSFAALTTVATPGNPAQVLAADINGDGKIDTIVGFSNSSVLVYLGNGDGTFQAPLSTGVEGNVIAVADLDGDGKLDLVMADGGPPGVIVALPGNGDGTFGTAVPVVSGVGSYGDMGIADVTGDGQPDILAVNITTLVVRVFPNTTFTAPGAPTIGVATAGNAQATVTFTAPASDGGKPITQYTATSTPGSFTGTCAAPCTSITVNSLVNGTSYRFSVRATNIMGTGTASALSNSVTPQGPSTTVVGSSANPSLHGAAMTFTATVSGAGPVPTGTVAFTDGGTPIAGCTARPLAAGAATCNATFTVVGGHSILATYSGDAPYTASSGALTQTVNATVPGAPVMSLASSFLSNVIVTFTPPSSDGGSAIIDYTATCGAGSGTGPGSPLTVSGLPVAVAVTCTVTARNAVGVGPPSAASNTATPRAGTSTSVTSSANPVIQGNAVTFTATVTGVSPTGTVGFTYDGAPITGCTAVVLVVGVASCTATQALSGLHTVAATYAGDIGNLPSSGPLPGGQVVIATPITSFTGPTATGTGIATVSFTGGGATCTFAPQGNGAAESAFFIPVTGHAKSPPSGTAPTTQFPHGLLDFVLTGCTPGSAVTFTVTYPAALPAGFVYWKYGPRPPPLMVLGALWYQLPATLAGNTATFTITDGAVGDDDLAPNGTIVDQGGPGVPGSPGTATAIPTLSQWMLVLLALMMGGLALRQRASSRNSVFNTLP